MVAGLSHRTQSHRSRSLRRLGFDNSTPRATRVRVDLVESSPHPQSPETTASYHSHPESRRNWFHRGRRARFCCLSRASGSRIGRFRTGVAHGSRVSLGEATTRLICWPISARQWARSSWKEGSKEEEPGPAGWQVQVRRQGGTGLAIACIQCEGDHSERNGQRACPFSLVPCAPESPIRKRQPTPCPHFERTR